MPRDIPAKREVVTWYPTTAVECSCRLDKRPNLIILIGFNNMAVCPECKWRVAATNVRPAMTPAGPSLEVEVSWYPPAKES